jgi:hypothetical protein
MSKEIPGIHARFNSGHIWAIIIGAIFLITILIWRIDVLVNNDIFHIYKAINTVNHNIRNFGTALQNHDVTKDFIFEWEELPPLHTEQ